MTSAAETSTGESWTAAFAHALRPLIDASRTEVAPPFDAAFAEQLGRRLVAIAARTLVLELHDARDTLTAPSSSERFTEFTRTLSLSSVFNRYPVLARLLAQACEQAVSTHHELSSRFTRDRGEIIRTIFGNTDPGALISIDMGQGDAHRQGRTVAILTFESGRRLIYRPRPVGLHARFQDQLDWLSQRTGIEFRTPRLLPRDGYGWLEHIPYVPCADVAGVAEFYKRLGALLALLYAVDGTDMHYENLIACGDQPVLVDVETLFHPTLTPDTDPATLALVRSVHRTALLPHVLLGDNGVADVSGVGGDHGVLSPLDAVDWADAGTDRMRLVRRPKTSSGALNRPLLQGQPAEPADYQDSLLAGFRAGYDAIVAHRDELLRLVQACVNEEVRFVARATRQYARLLDESTHPSVLADALDRDLAFGVLVVDDPLLDRLVPFEVSDLWRGDVPLFTCRPGSTDLWTASGLRLPGMLPEPGLHAVTRKILAMSEVDRHDQQWVITALLASRPRPVSHHSGVAVSGHVAPVDPDPARLLVAACGIADQILAHAVTGKDRVNWLGLELVDDRHWTVQPLGAGLSNGYTGVALFLAELGALTGAARYEEFARDALRPLPALLEMFAGEPELVTAVGGGIHGLGGICYGLARLTSLLGLDSELLTQAVRLMPQEDSSLTVVDGVAGSLAAMLAVGTPESLALADHYASTLRGAICPANGFARGHAGIGWALKRYAATFHDKLSDVTARSFLESDAIDPTDTGWCTGLAGAALARDDERLAGLLASRKPLRDMSLCHGELGVVEALAAHHPSAATRRTALLLGALEEHGAHCATPGGVPSPGLFTGLAGIGHGLLRQGFPVPSVLLLQSSPDKEECT
ncbi:type 2 lanthipeptide synthetase LanM family protein [Lentzea sp. NBC_00516]|uniref:type 2 lanthipeptide synthetase LanM family protein n=1 Tax=Lentzea sp. NBC_00516 TaxID=2903582 RepID=UPI002E81C121|nr:type 2 lanthipeptide synthetase LanM family protein [Lentzea sp. NBC_00516]WUD28992.1 type 2 lanthipeptide synthetase LanM family protein [Lentzea sp. NBC_00516]